ncbi:MAG: magnesium transporter [Thermoguttaceae bacterium]|nr:magnesium transporter [Thermoguttaceae bacterium]
MINTLYLPELREMLANDDKQGLKEFCEALHHPYQTAEFMEGLTAEESWAVLRCADMSDRVDIFLYLPWEKQVEMLETSDPKEAGEFIAYLPPDDRVDLLNELPDEIAERIMQMTPEEDRHDIQRLSQYDENTVGAIMTTAVAKITENLTPREAVEAAKKQAEEMETIYYLYVVDEEDHLRGLLTFRELICSLGKPDVKVSDIMERNLITIKPTEDREEASMLVAKYDVLALPVVDDEYHLIGIITHDDVMDVVIDEAEEDAQIAAGVSPLEDEYLDSPIHTIVWKRGMWLVILFVGAFLTVFTLCHAQEQLDKLPWLAFFIPMIVSVGGNSGNQSATLVITSITNGSIRPSDFFRVFCREILIGLSLGLVLGLVGIGFSLCYSCMDPDVIWYQLGIILPTTVILVVLCGSIIGAMLPLFFSKIGLDPALMSNPFVAGIIDVLGLVIYLNVALFFMPGLK